MENILNYLDNEITIIGGVVAAIALALLALVVMFKALSGGGRGVRELLGSVGMILAACVLLGGATAIVGIMINFGESLPGA